MKYFKHFYSVIIFVFLRLIFCVTKKVSVIITSYENNNTKIIWVQICTLWETYYFWNKLVILPPLTFFGNKDHFLIFMCHAVIEVAYETNATLNRLTPYSFSPSTNVFLLVFNSDLFLLQTRYYSDHSIFLYYNIIAFGRFFLPNSITFFSSL